MQTQQVDTVAIERLISQVRGVIGSRVLGTPDGGISEVHVVAAPHRSAKQMVRDVESIIYVRGGVRVDYRKISLVQLSEMDLPALARQVRLIDIERSTSAYESSLGVTLALGEQQVYGMAHGRYDQQPPARLAAAATVQALNQLLGDERFQLVDLCFQPFGETEVCLSQLLDSTDSATLLGMSISHSDAETTAVRSVLDALGRAPHHALQRILEHGATS